MRSTIGLCFAAACMFLFACSPAATDYTPGDTPSSVASPAAHAGTWMLNVSKSSYDPGPAPKSQTVTIEAWGDDGLTYVAEGVAADDSPTHLDFQAKFDGQDYEARGNPDVEALSYRPIDANTLEATLKRQGEAVMTANIVLSEEGRVRTVTQTGKDAQGRDVHIVSVYEKQ